MPGKGPRHSGTEQDNGGERPAGQDFLRAIISNDMRTGKHQGRVVTRFPPEPNGYLHIGHAKSVCLNFGLAEQYGGVCHLRFDDTNPETEDIKYVEAIKRDVRWLGFDWGEHLYFASDYFQQMYQFGEELIRKGLAYVDSLKDLEIREHRGTISEPGTASPYRDRGVEENLELFRGMRDGKFPDGAHVLRAKIDMGATNMLMRDPVLYRIRHATHYRSGDAWCIYPMYDYAHPLGDALEHITHSICTLEFENNRELYDWVVDNVSVPYRPYQYEFARLNLQYTVMSKRLLLQLVNGGHVSGWDDPRMPTIAGLRRRGFTPESIRSFCDMIGVSKVDSRVDMGKLEYAVRDDLNRKARRVLCVVRPLRIVITNYPAEQVEEFEAPYYPRDVPLEGSRKLPFSRELYIDRDDFMEEPIPGFFRLSPGAEVRLRYAYIIRCHEVIKDQDGNLVELRCSYDPDSRGGKPADGRKVKGTIHWVSASHAARCRLRLYDRLFRVPEPDRASGESGEPLETFLNPESLVVETDARLEPAARQAGPGEHFQFERVGYFFVDPEDSRPGEPVFNRTVTLRDSWAKLARAATPAAAGKKPVPGTGPHEEKPAHAAAATRDSASGETADAAGTSPGKGAVRRSPVPDRPQHLLDKQKHYQEELGLAGKDAEILTRTDAMAEYFEAALAGGPSPKATANWLIHELTRELSDRPLEELPLPAGDFGRLVSMVEREEISSTSARGVLSDLVKRGGDPVELVEERGLRQIKDAESLRPVVEGVLADHAGEVKSYRAGRTGLLGFFVGRVLERTKGRANPQLTRQLLEDLLAGEPD